MRAKNLADRKGLALSRRQYDIMIELLQGTDSWALAQLCVDASYASEAFFHGVPPALRDARQDHTGGGMAQIYELDAIAASVIGGVSLTGAQGRTTGTVIGALILGVISGFTFLRVDVYYQDIIKGGIMGGAVIVDQDRQRRRAKKS